MSSVKTSVVIFVAIMGFVELAYLVAMIFLFKRETFGLQGETVRWLGIDGSEILGIKAVSDFATVTLPDHGHFLQVFALTALAVNALITVVYFSWILSVNIVRTIRCGSAVIEVII